MIIEMLEIRYPPGVDKAELKSFWNSVYKPACKKVGYKMFRSCWIYTGGPMNMEIFIGELDSLADLQRVETAKEMQEAQAEWQRRFPGAEVTQKILQVVQ